MIIYPYYKLFKANTSKLIGLTGANVVIQKKYDDKDTIAITSEYGEIIIGSKKFFDDNTISSIRLNLSDNFKKYINERDNLIFYGSILNNKIVLWDAWDKYNNMFVDTFKYITKYKAYEYYSGPFDIGLLEQYNNKIIRFQYPQLTYIINV